MGVGCHEEGNKKEEWKTLTWEAEREVTMDTEEG